MTGAIRDDVAVNIVPEERQIADKIQHLVPGRLVRIAQSVLDWSVLAEDQQVGHARVDAETLAAACFNGYITIDATGGTGGGMFRYMYARFLRDVADITGEPGYNEIGSRLHAAGECWQQVAALFDKAHREADPAGPLAEIPPLLRAVANIEEAAWGDLVAVTGR